MKEPASGPRSGGAVAKARPPTNHSEHHQQLFTTTTTKDNDSSVAAAVLQRGGVTLQLCRGVATCRACEYPGWLLSVERPVRQVSQQVCDVGEGESQPCRARERCAKGGEGTRAARRGNECVFSLPDDFFSALGLTWLGSHWGKPYG